MVSPTQRFTPAVTPHTLYAHVYDESGPQNRWETCRLLTERTAYYFVDSIIVNLIIVL